MRLLSEVTVTPAGAALDGKAIAGTPLSLTALYRSVAGDYPKFFKMDGLSRLGFLAAELLLRDIDPADKHDAAIVLFNRSGSLTTDRNYQRTIADQENYFPSPALFVYTLANIVTGEIAIRHKIYGESSFYIIDEPDWPRMEEIAGQCLLTSTPPLLLAGWVEYDDDDCFHAEMRLYTNRTCGAERT